MDEDEKNIAFRNFKKLFRPWELILHNYVKEYNAIRAAMERNISNFIQAFEKICILYQHRNNKVKPKHQIESLEKLMLEKVPLAEEKVNELVNLHLVFLSILLVLLGIPITTLLTGGGT